MKQNDTHLGKIITFYSFKGGVGRSMAVANVSVLLAQWGYRTLIIDWDLEAPGLEKFFSDYSNIEKVESKIGLIDLLLDSMRFKRKDKKIHWKDCIVPIYIDNTKQLSKIDLITAGSNDEFYYEKVRSFDFNNFYEKYNGGEIIETLRNEWLFEYDFVLIDSRTGVTDIGGVCTIQLPDILLILFTPTQQSLDGAKRIALKAMEAQRKLPYERINLLTLPVPTRIDNTEYKLAKKWFEVFEKELKEIYSHWLPDLEESFHNEFLINSKVPYISYFSFGEKIPVLEEGVNNPTSMGYSYQSIASLLATHLNHPDLLVKNRVKLIDYAKKAALNKLIENKVIFRRKIHVAFISLIRKAYKLLSSNISVGIINIILVTFISLSAGFYALDITSRQQKLLKEYSILQMELYNSRAKYDSSKYILLKRNYELSEVSLTLERISSRNFNEKNRNEMLENEIQRLSKILEKMRYEFDSLK